MAAEGFARFRDAYLQRAVAGARGAGFGRSARP